MSTTARNNASPRGRRVLAIALPVLVLPLVAVLPAAASSAKGGQPKVQSSGACSGPSHWKLSAKADDGRIEVEAEVDTPANGRTWAWQLADQGVTVASGKAVTHAPSGSFTVHRRIPNRPGGDVIRFQARAARSGETCTGTVRLG